MEELKHLHMLTEQIGPRGSTKRNEQLAAHYIKESMEKSGLGVEVQEFTSVKSFSWTYGLIYSLFCFSFIIFPFSRFVSFLLCLFGLYVFIREVNTREIISKFMPGGLSQNVLGKIKAKKYPVKTVIFTAHYDTSRSGLMFDPESVKNFRVIFLFNYISMGIISVLYGLSNFLVNPHILTLWYLSFPFALFLFTSLLMLIQRELRGDYISGANDNASGVSVLLELAREFSSNPFDFVEPWFLATGSKEAGTVGMIKFLDHYKLNKENTFFVNLDSIGTGDLKYILKEGILKQHHADSKLLKMARLSAEEKPKLNFTGASYNLLATDATAAMARGYKAMTLIALDDEGMVSNWHWHTDTYERVEKGNLQAAKEMSKRIIARIHQSI
ncbi:M28 family metallopeptidase [Candidatus Contubernalis alkaliaceticus]|uniref:M28 family metallopeptidase n=1 Tax=Candidatus Contubernalis alkaliaceticus TaxID=338645 RepID=UPI001F4C313D|nr:M28 family peptidase [Candidatus Contubernalis alkalaceticus]UNC92359.1 M28 family peptidase [Candidatus Contubernalis alkalaceticus]